MLLSSYLRHSLHLSSCCCEADVLVVFLLVIPRLLQPLLLMNRLELFVSLLLSPLFSAVALVLVGLSVCTCIPYRRAVLPAWPFAFVVPFVFCLALVRCMPIDLDLGLDLT